MVSSVNKREDQQGMMVRETNSEASMAQHMVYGQGLK
jgi:hypothetical protein